MNVPKPIEQNGQRVLTTAQLAEAYGTDAKIIRRNFERNKERYQEGKHFYALTGEELKKFVGDNLSLAISSKARKMFIWTERGALLHAKSLNTDKAWEVYDYLIEHYFQAPRFRNIPSPPEPDYTTLEVKRRAMGASLLNRLAAKASIKRAEAEIAQAELMEYIAANPWLSEVTELPMLKYED